MRFEFRFGDASHLDTLLNRIRSIDSVYDAHWWCLAPPTEEPARLVSRSRAARPGGHVVLAGAGAGAPG